MGLNSLTGCSAIMAAKQPSKKDEKLLAHGMPRARIVAEFGAPVTSEHKNGERVDVYVFKQGYSKTAKIGRTLFHGVADIATVGLWEVVGTPAESAFDGTDVAYQVKYDENDRVVEIVQLKK